MIILEQKVLKTFDTNDLLDIYEAQMNHSEAQRSLVTLNIIEREIEQRKNLE